MKLILVTNWSLLVIYILALSYTALTINPSNTDAAGRGLAEVYIVGGFVLLAILIGINCLPFRLTRLGVFTALLVPITVGFYQVIREFMINKRTQLAEAERFDGSFYFHDSQRQQLARAIATQDEATFQSLLQQPMPQLNESGEDHITLLDYAAMCGTTSDELPWTLHCLALLVKKGATIQTADTLRMPTHALVSRNCSAALLEWFLKNGADPNAKQFREEPVLILFTVMEYDRDRLAKVKLLLQYGAEPNSIYPPTAAGWLAGHSALLAAARQELWEECQLLLENGADSTIESPQKLRFNELIKRKTEIYAASAKTPASFVALVEAINRSVPK